ncbi:MAG: hypothetical protein AB1758_06535 [Candidatus Eremiobacterota bacterium]
MESVPFQNVYQVVTNPASGAARSSAPVHTDANAFQNLMNQAAGEPTNTVQSQPGANLLFNRMGAGVSMPPQGLHRTPESQSRVDEARTSLYHSVLSQRGIPADMIRDLAAGGGANAFVALRGVQPEGSVDGTQAELQRVH